MKEFQYLTQYHPTFYENLKYVYPVVSRRAGGISIGVNLSLTRHCNFSCCYCQVDRSQPLTAEMTQTTVDLEILENELYQTAMSVLTGQIFQHTRFERTPEPKRVLRDFAFSGDGEPTLSPQFFDAADVLIHVRKRLGYPDLKLVLITNGTNLQNDTVIASLDALARNNGEFWIKLDAGTPEYYARINQSRVPYDKILSSIQYAGTRWNIVIQTMLLQIKGVSPSNREIECYCDRLVSFLKTGCHIDKIQFYTVARKAADPDVGPLSSELMDKYVQTIQRKIGISCEVYYSH